MGLVREIKERLSGVEAKARQLPVSGEGGIVALPSEQGTSILDHRRFNAYPTHRLGQIRSNGGTESLEDFTDEVYWVQFMRLGGSAQNVSPPLHPDLDEEAIAVPATNLAERTAESVGGEGTHRLPPGTVVLLFMEEDDEGNLRWVFSGAAEETIPVLCTVDGGVAGSASTTCTLTYSLKRVSGGTGGAVIATGKTPKRTRYGNCEYDSPAADSYGIACYDDTGTIQLLDVFAEKPKGDEVTVIDGASWSEPNFVFTTQKILVLEDRGAGSNISVAFTECAPP
jgi:hypothetical protein